MLFKAKELYEFANGVWKDLRLCIALVPLYNDNQ